MSPIRETELAGIGRKYSVDTRSGDQLHIVVHEGGEVELYYTPREDKNATLHVATLDEEEARQVAAIIGRTIYRPEAIERLGRHGVTIAWHRLSPTAHAIGKKLGELDVGQRTGASIIAVIGKDGAKRTNPGNDFTFDEGSQAAMAGTQKEVEACAELLEKGPR